MLNTAAKSEAPGTEQNCKLTDGFHLVIDALKLNGINTIYNVPGIPITDLGRMAQAAGIRVLSFRHEQNAGYAAAIAGFLTKKPGVCLTVSAPGFLNGLTALAHATTNCFPMILVSGSSEREVVDLQQGDYEEMDQLAIAKPLCKAAFRVLHAQDIGIGFARAIRAAVSTRGARKTNADVLGVQHAERRLAQRLCDRKLIHLFIVALLQVDDLALGRTRDQDHREAVGGGMRQRGEAVEEARRRNRQADAGFLGQEAGDRSRVACILLVAERQHADARRLRHAAEIGDRNARHAVDGVDAVELERIDNEMKAIREFLLGLLGVGVLAAVFSMGCISLIVSGSDELIVFCVSRSK